MNSVSTAYKEQINKPCRNVSHMRINIYQNYKEEGQVPILSIDTTLDANLVDLASAVWEREYDPLNTKLPIESFEFSIIDKKVNQLA